MTDKQLDILTTDSVQTRAHDNTGVSGVSVPQPFLLPFFRPRNDLDIPRWGFAGRDPMLGRVWKAVGADLVACAVAVLSQKVLSTDYSIEGPERTVNSRCRQLLDTAELGDGYTPFICKFTQALSVYDNGVFVELISEAPPLTYPGGTDQRYIDEEVVPDLSAPRVGPVLGIAVMDSIRCARTRDIEFPVRYYDLQGRMHLIHRSRVWFTSDMPSTEEAMYNYGFCALSRCLSTLHYGVNWSAARNEMLDAMPPLQYLAVNGINKDQFMQQAKEYQAQRQAFGEYVLRSVMMLVSPNSDKPISFQSENIRQLWESFDEQTALNTSIDMVAMAFGLDHQDLAPLSTSSMGSGAQSSVLDEKTRGKGPGYVRTVLESFFKAVFPASCTFEFDYQDDKQDLQRAAIVNAKLDAVLKLFNGKQGGDPTFGGLGNPFATKAATVPDGALSQALGVDVPEQPMPDQPSAEFLINRQQALQLLMKEIPDWAEILDPDGTMSEDVTIDALTPELQEKSAQLYGPRVRYHSKSGKCVTVKVRRKVKPITQAELTQAAFDLQLMGIDLDNVRQYANR